MRQRLHGPRSRRPSWWRSQNAICGPLNAHIVTTGAGTIRHLAAHGPMLYAWERVALSELEKLVPPSGFAGDWATGLRTLAEHTELGAQMAKHDSKGEKVYPFLSAEQYAGERAERDGWRQCAHVTLLRSV